MKLTFVVILLTLSSLVSSAVVHRHYEEKPWQKSGKYQGDMILTRNQKNGVLSEFYRWPNRTLVYEFDPEVSVENQEIIISALEYYNLETCVTVTARTDESHYVQITTKDEGCYSYVGRIGGRQYLNLQPDLCIRDDVILHEFLHALGFHHMQSATERDDYINILWENILPDHIFDFDKYGPEVITSFGETYDLQSIMHYDAYAFSANGFPTMEAIEPGAEIGGSTTLTEIDKAKLEKMYGCVD